MSQRTAGAPRGAADGTGTRVAIVTLGCARNEVDSDQLAGLLRQQGMTVVDDPEGADAVLVNTCTFIEPAKQESIDTVLAAGALKDSASVRALLVVGCMAQRYPQELADAIPEADAIVGFDGYTRLPSIVTDILSGSPVARVTVDAPPRDEPRGLPLVSVGGGQPADATPTGFAQDELDRAATDFDRAAADLDRMPASGPRFPVRRFDGGPWAYLKIASGCDRTCTFCAIPSFRGRFRSRPLGEILAEASFLVDGGARELVLVSENTTSYGKDVGGRDLQTKLLEELSALDGLERIRLMYLQPSELRFELLETMAALPKVCSYFDLSLQHVSSRLLRSMARGGSPDAFADLVAHIRWLDPGAVFRSSFILGFPGETEDDVDELEAFLSTARLDWAGFFTFSPEDGTPSAGYPDQVPHDVAVERMRRLTSLQERLADDAARRFVGRELTVTVEEVGDGICAGRSYREAPDTDGEVRLVGADGAPAPLATGATVPAEVVAAEGVDLIAVPVDPPPGP